MIVQSLTVGGNPVNITTPPDGINDISLVYERDYFNGMSISVDQDIVFRCGNGKEEIDAEYLANFENGIGEIVLIDECNGIEIEIIFRLDFSKYKSNGSYTSIGLDEVNSTNDFKDALKTDVEIPDALGKDVYIRNLPLEYKYYSDYWTAEEDQVGVTNVIDMFYPISAPQHDYAIGLYPRTHTSYNELESGYELLSETMVDTGRGISIGSWYNSPMGKSEILNPLPATSPVPGTFQFSIIEPQPIFTNELEDGYFEISLSGLTELDIDFTGASTGGGNNALIDFVAMDLCEYMACGRNFSEPHKWSYALKIVLNDNPNTYPFPGGTPNFLYQNATMSSRSFTKTIFVKRGESIWIWHELFTRRRGFPSGTLMDYYFVTDKYSYTLNRAVDIKFTLNENVTTGDILNNADIENFSTKVKAFHGHDVAGTMIPSLSSSLFQDACYSDFYLTNGEYLRSKINKKKFNMKPQNFFDAIDGILSVGLGVFYDSSGVPTLRLGEFSEFYDTFTVSIIIDTVYYDITIETDTSRLYNDYEIGYAKSKDTVEEIHGRNMYNAPEQVKGKSSWSKVSAWVASKYTIKSASSLGTEDKDLEFDKDIFILSAKDNGTNHIHTLSQNSNPSALGHDDITEANTATVFGLNRRYSTIFNLVRNVIRWGFGMYKGKTAMNNNSLSTKTITGGSSLTNCGLNKTINANSSVNYGDVAPSASTYYLTPKFITFQVLMSIGNFWELRKKWYQTVRVGANTYYYGNIIRAEYKKGVVKFKLISQ